MYHINEIELDFEPRNKVLQKLPSGAESHIEMSNFDSGFLCGLLKKFKPKKILELGVAEGGTTSIILQCLEDLNYDYEMHSVDIMTKWFDGVNHVGHLAGIAKKSLNVKNHQFHLGGGITFHLNEIGKDFDFVILDTSHFLPGELLDFLVVINILKEDAVICMHDICCHQMNADLIKHATGVLFSTVTAEKYLNFIPSEMQLSQWCFPRISGFTYPNIGAFQITKQTKDNILDLFCALMLRWKYMPPISEMDNYNKFIHQTYDEAACKIYDEAVKSNSYNLNVEDKYQILKFIPRRSKVFILSDQQSIFDYINENHLELEILSQQNAGYSEYIVIAFQNLATVIEFESRLIHSGFNKKNIIKILTGKY